MEEISISIKDLSGLLPVVLALVFAMVIISMNHFFYGSKKILFFLFLSFAFSQFILAIRPIGYSSVATQLLFLYVPILMLVPPLFFLYLSSLCMNERIINTKKIYLHFILPSIFLIVNISIYGTMMLSSKQDTRLFLFDIFYYLILGGLIIVFTIQNIVYIIWSIKVYLKFKKYANDFFSFETQFNLKWMSIYLLGYMLFIFIVYIVEIFKIGSGWLYDLMLSCYIFFLGFKGLKQYDYYLNMKLAIDFTSKEEGLKAEKKKIDTNTVASPKTITDSRDHEVMEKIKTLLEEEKVYLKPELTLFDIAKELQINYKYVSQAINNCFGKNFNTLINEYRVQDAQILLQDQETSQYTLEAISQMVGFKSKSSFYTFFKKYTGKTPSEYRDVA